MHLPAPDTWGIVAMYVFQTNFMLAIDNEKQKILLLHRARTVNLWTTWCRCGCCFILKFSIAMLFGTFKEMTTT